MHTLFVITTAAEKIQIKCRIMWHFIMDNTVCIDKKYLLGKKLQFCLEIETCDPLNYTMGYSKCIASIQKRIIVLLFTIFNSKV